MLIKPSLEKLLPKVDNRYTLALMIAKRARQLVDGALPLIESDSPNLVTLACEELSLNRITWVRGQVNPYIPLRPEIEAARLAARTAAAHASMADAVKDALDLAVGLTETDDLDDTDASLIAESIMNLDEETGFDIVDGDTEDKVGQGDEDVFASEMEENDEAVMADQAEADSLAEDNA
jgi:DNA-directed RNA polymerase subunit omega